jgi:hypothetical protein
MLRWKKKFVKDRRFQAFIHYSIILMVTFKVNSKNKQNIDEEKWKSISLIGYHKRLLFFSSDQTFVQICNKCCLFDSFGFDCNSIQKLYSEHREKRIHYSSSSSEYSVLKILLLINRKNSYYMIDKEKQCRNNLISSFIRHD